MPRPATDMHRLQIMLTREQYRELVALAERRGSALAEVVRRAVEAFLREQGK